MLKLSAALAMLVGLITDKELMRKLLIAIIVPGGATLMLAHMIWTRYTPEHIRVRVDNVRDRIMLAYMRFTT